MLLVCWKDSEAETYSDVMQQYVGEFFSKEYVMKNVLLLDDDAMKEMKDQIAQEKSSGEIPDDSEEDQDGN